MYSNERGSRFSVLDIFMKVIFAALFIFILVWLFPKVPNMTPFYSNVFRENIKYMQEAGESYFTDDKMPKEVGDSETINLADMFNKKLLLPFVDKNGNSCDQYDSYVSVTKLEDGYELKTNLECNDEEDYTIKILGCHTYCKDSSCSKTCSIEKIVEYQYKKYTTTTNTKYSCPKGYKLSGKYCYKKKLIDTKSAEVTTVTTKIDEKDAKLVVVGGTKILLETIVTAIPSKNVKTYVDALTKIVGGGTTTDQNCTTTQVAYSCPSTSTERVCKTTTKTESYKCNCTTYRDSNGKSVTTCSTCTRSIPVETCSDQTVTTPGTCYKPVTTCNPITTQIPGVTEKYCPSIATGSEGSGSSLKCFYYQQVGGGYSYTCPADATNYEGSNSTLKCYKVTNASSHYECEDKTYTLRGAKCYKTITGTFTELKCDKGYKLEGKVCNKYSTEKIKATKKTTKTNGYIYKWSTKTSLSGWNKTGKTRIIDGKEICE